MAVENISSSRAIVVYSTIGVMAQLLVSRLRLMSSLGCFHVIGLMVDLSGGHQPATSIQKSRGSYVEGGKGSVG